MGKRTSTTLAHTLHYCESNTTKPHPQQLLGGGWRQSVTWLEEMWVHSGLLSRIKTTPF